MKHTIAFTTFVILGLVAPYLSGPLMMANEKRFTKWEWLPREPMENEKTISFSPDELRFTSE